MTEFGSKCPPPFFFIYSCLSPIVSTVHARSDRFSVAHIYCTVSTSTSTNRGYFFSFVIKGKRRVGLLWRIIWGSSLYVVQVSGKPVSDNGSGLKRLQKREMHLFHKESTFIIQHRLTFSIAPTVSAHISSSFSRPLSPKNPTWDPCAAEVP